MQTPTPTMNCRQFSHRVASDSPQRHRVSQSPQRHRVAADPAPSSPLRNRSTPGSPTCRLNSNLDFGAIVEPTARRDRRVDHVGSPKRQRRPQQHHASPKLPKLKMSFDETAADTAIPASLAARIEDAAVRWWHRNGGAFYPRKMTTSVTGLVSSVFWHSFLITLHTPLKRMLGGDWVEEAALPFAYNAFWQLATGVDPQWIPAVVYKGAAQNPQTDRAFGAHAFFGLLWLLTSYAQMVLVPAKYHRRFGYFSLAVLACHLFGCFNILGVDHQHHKSINKQVLLTVAIISVFFFGEGMRVMISKKARAALGDGWKLAHQDAMVNGFIWTVSGAGPIRQIFTVQVLFGMGPSFCQEEHGGKSTHCTWPYVFRLMFIALWNCAVSGAYCVHRQDAALTKKFLRNTSCLVAGMLIGSHLAHVPETVALFDAVLGKELTHQSTAGVVTLSGVYSLYLAKVGTQWMFAFHLVIMLATLAIVTVVPISNLTAIFA